MRASTGLRIASVVAWTAGILFVLAVSYDYAPPWTSVIALLMGSAGGKCSVGASWEHCKEVKCASKKKETV